MVTWSAIRPCRQLEGWRSSGGGSTATLMRRDPLSSVLIHVLLGATELLRSWDPETVALSHLVRGAPRILERAGRCCRVTDDANKKEWSYQALIPAFFHRLGDFVVGSVVSASPNVIPNVLKNPPPPAPPAQRNTGHGTLALSGH